MPNHKIKWNNYIYSVDKWADHLNTTYPLDDYKMTVRLSDHSCERIVIKAGKRKNLMPLNDLEFLDSYYSCNPNNNLGTITTTILDEKQLDYTKYENIKDKTRFRHIYIKNTKEEVAYERYGVSKDFEVYCSLVLMHKCVPYIIDTQLIVFATEDLKVRAIPLMDKQKELNKKLKAEQKIIDKYKRLILDHKGKQGKIKNNLEDIKYQLSNKSPHALS